jgi:Plasmid recombination enzyme
MIEHTQLLRIEKMKGGGKIKAAARHNLREIQAEQGADSHIDPLKMIQNIILRGADNAADVASLAVQLMEQAKVKRRSDEVLGLEVIVSLRPASGMDEKAFFEAAVNWADNFFEIPILSAVIHNDEAAPHCHIVMLPLFDGRMMGSALVGSKARLSAMQADFFEKVGQPYGLTRPTPLKRFSSVARATAAAIAIDYLVTHPKSLNEPTIRDAFRDALTDNPMPVMAALGFDMPESKKPKPKTFASYLTKRCKPEKPIGFNQFAKVIPIGFELKKEAEKEQSLSCVGFGNNPHTLEPPKRQIDDDLQDDYSRVRDDDLPVEEWHDGEAIKRPTNIKARDKEIERVKGAIQAMPHRY